MLWGGRKIDNSDHQWRTFRNALPMATLLFALYAAGSRLALHVARARGATLEGQMYVRAAVALAGIFILHGLNTFKILALLAANYAIGRACGGTRAAVPVAWAYALAVLFGIEYIKIRTWSEHNPLRTLSLLFDAAPGFYPRWHIAFNFSTLRMLSYNLDYHYSLLSPPPLEVRARAPRRWIGSLQL